MISDKTGKLVAEGLKEAGINFFANLPDAPSTKIDKWILKDPASFKYYHYSDEGGGFSACVGAWYGGMKPAMWIFEAGLFNNAWALMAFKNYHCPVLMLAPHSPLGTAPTGSSWFMRKYIHKIERYLEVLDVPYFQTQSLDDIKPMIKEAVNTIDDFMIPAVIFIKGSIDSKYV